MSTSIGAGLCQLVLLLLLIVGIGSMYIACAIIYIRWCGSVIGYVIKYGSVRGFRYRIVHVIVRLEDGNIKIHWESNIWVSSRFPLPVRLGDGNLRTHWGSL